MGANQLPIRKSPLGGNPSPSSPKQKVQSWPALIAGIVKIIEAVVHPFHNSMENALDIQLNASDDRASSNKRPRHSEIMTLASTQGVSRLPSADAKEAKEKKPTRPNPISNRGVYS